MELEEMKQAEQIIVTERGTYRHVQVTLPMPVKMYILSWMRKPGMGKTEFFRDTVMM